MNFTECYVNSVIKKVIFLKHRFFNVKLYYLKTLQYVICYMYSLQIGIISTGKSYQYIKRFIFV